MDYSDDIIAGGVTRGDLETAMANCPPCARPTCGRALAQHHRKGLYLACEESGCEHFQRASESKKTPAGASAG